MELSFQQENPHVMNLRAEGMGTISRYAWYPELHPHITCLLGPGKRNVLENQPADHLHHHGVCFSHGVVNDELDFYLYRDKRNLGQINLVGDVQTKAEDNVAALAHDSEWIAPDGKELITTTAPTVGRCLTTVNFTSIRISACDPSIKRWCFTPPMNPECRWYVRPIGWWRTTVVF